jgi:hypothetical protein
MQSALNYLLPPNSLNQPLNYPIRHNFLARYRIVSLLNLSGLSPHSKFSGINIAFYPHLGERYHRT